MLIAMERPVECCSACFFFKNQLLEKTMLTLNYKIVHAININVPKNNLFA